MFIVNTKKHESGGAIGYGQSAMSNDIILLFVRLHIHTYRRRVKDCMLFTDFKTTRQHKEAYKSHQQRKEPCFQKQAAQQSS